MTKKLFVLCLVLAAGLTAAPLSLLGSQTEVRVQRTRTRDQNRDRNRDRDDDRDDDRDSDGQKQFSERDEINQTYDLGRGARVEVSGINGRVDIETSNTGKAEVHIARSARDRADLEYHKIIIEHAADRLVIRGEKDGERNSGGRNREVRQQVTLKIPREVDLSSSGINGRVTVGAIDGPVKLSGINGRVDVAQARVYTHLSGINGRVTVTIAALGEQGIHVSGINGGVELQFAEEVNADLNVSGVNGTVYTDVANVTIQGKMERSNFRARIGSGGSPISVSGVNGRVRLSRVGTSG